MAGLFDLRTPFFRPAWRRALATGLVLGWAGVELASGAVAWAMLFGAAGLWCLWSFFLAFDPADYEPKDTEGPEP